MNELDQFALSAIKGTAGSALESDFLAQRAYSIAKACMKIKGDSSEKPDADKKTPNNGKRKPRKRKTDFTKARFSKDGTYIIPADLTIFNVLEKMGKPSCAGDIVRKYNEESEHNCALHHVLSILERIHEHGWVDVDRSARPFMWSCKENPDLTKTEEQEKPKLDEKTDTYSRKLKFSKDLGYKNVTEAIADLGKDVFNQKFKRRK